MTMDVNDKDQKVLDQTEEMNDTEQGGTPREGWEDEAIKVRVQAKLTGRTVPAFLPGTVSGEPKPNDTADKGKFTVDRNPSYGTPLSTNNDRE